MPSSERIVHPLAPVWDDRSCALVLGTMPSPASRAVNFYYGNPRNRFWRVAAALWDEPEPETNEGRRAFCLAHRIALWDVLASCDIVGASDASIEDPVPNDLSRVLDSAPILTIFCTGSTAARLYRRLIEPTLGRSCVALPSTSPANARMRLADLVSAYAPLRVACTQPHLPQ